MNVRVKIKRLSEHAVIPQYAHNGDICFDIVAAEDVIIEPGQTAKVPTGWAMQQPPGYAIEIRPRSGISERTKLRIANTPGTIDQYTGEICVLIDNIAQKEYVLEDCGEWHGNERLSDFRLEVAEDYVIKSLDNESVIAKGNHPVGTYIIRKGERIAQALVAPVERAHFVEVAELDETARGTGGFGSSGVKSAFDKAVAQNGGALERLAKEDAE